MEQQQLTEQKESRLNNNIGIRIENSINVINQILPIV